MTCLCESPLAIALKTTLPKYLQDHPWHLLELAAAVAQDYDCPLCEILTPLGEALTDLADSHAVIFDGSNKELKLA